MDTFRKGFEGPESSTTTMVGTGKIPTLKVLVSQKLENNNESNIEISNYPDTPQHLSSFDAEGDEKLNCENLESTKGDGDIASSTGKGFLESGEIEVNNLLSAAYHKGSQWLQAGLSLFGEEDVQEDSRRDPEEEGEEEDDEDDVEVTEETFEVVSQSKKAVSDKIPADVDDTAYYNGYNIRVRGQGIVLDTLFLNGNGSCKTGLEIKVSLLRDPTPELHATVHAFYDPDDNKLTLKYYHGIVQGLIEITCPPQVNVNDLKNDHKGDYIVITAP